MTRLGHVCVALAAGCAPLDVPFDPVEVRQGAPIVEEPDDTGPWQPGDDTPDDGLDVLVDYRGTVQLQFELAQGRNDVCEGDGEATWDPTAEPPLQGQFGCLLHGLGEPEVTLVLLGRAAGGHAEGTMAGEAVDGMIVLQADWDGVGVGSRFVGRLDGSVELFGGGSWPLTGRFELDRVDGGA